VKKFGIYQRDVDMKNKSWGSMAQSFVTEEDSPSSPARKSTMTEKLENERGAKMGVVKIKWELVDLVTQDELLQVEFEDIKDVKARNGVLGVTVNGLANCNTAAQNDKFHVQVDMHQHEENKNLFMKDKKFPAAANAKEQSKMCVLTYEKEQWIDTKNQEIFVNAQTMRESWLTFKVFRNESLLGTALTKLEEVNDLIDGKPKNIILDDWEVFDSKSLDKVGSKKPSIMVTLNYLSSIFTKKNGTGNINLLIRSWMQGDEVLPTNTWAKLKFFDADQKEINYQKWQYDDKKQKLTQKEIEKINVGYNKEIQCSSNMTSVQLMVYRKKSNVIGMEQDHLIGEVRIYLAELFGNAKLQAIVPRYFNKELVDKQNSSLINISFRSKFMPNPTQFDDNEMRIWKENAIKLEKRTETFKEHPKTNYLQKQETEQIVDPVTRKERSSIKKKLKDCF
jgi:hypothetical protein